jgi:glycosyltransferase involved in cell wall biosynthesis
MNGTQLSSATIQQQSEFPKKSDDVPMSVKPSVSVIINNYNYADYVAEAIESVLRQADDRVQCIVVDDGSTDGSLDIIRQYENVLVITRANGGQVAAVKTALPHAHSDIIVFLDSDDYLYDNEISVVREAWRPGLTMLQFALDEIDARGNKLGRLPDKNFVLERSGRADSEVRLYSVRANLGKCVFKTFRAFASMDETAGRFYFDAFLIFGAPLFGPVAVMDQALGVYRIHGRNVTIAAKQKVSHARREILNEVWHREAIEIFAERANLKAKKAERYLGPYRIRTMLLLNRAYGGLVSAPANNFTLAGTRWSNS